MNTSPYAAEFGRTGGGVVSFSIKSGTNDLHGTFHEFLRNSVLDASGFNSNRAGLTEKPSFKRNQFGLTSGGPVVIPKLYNGKNRTFWFFAYEGLRQRSLRAFTGTVPTELERIGDFSQSRDTNGQPFVIYDPRTTRLDPDRPAGTARYIRDPFAGNRIPRDCSTRLRQPRLPTIRPREFGKLNSTATEMGLQVEEHVLIKSFGSWQFQAVAQAKGQSGSFGCTFHSP